MSMNNAGHLSGILFAFAAALLFASAPVIRETTIALDSAFLLPAQYLGGGFVLFLAALLFQRKELFAFSPIRCMRISLIAFLLFVLPAVCLYWGRIYTLRVNADFISDCLPVLLAVCAAMVFGEHVRVRKVIALVLFAAGCLLLTGVVTMSGFHLSFQYPFGDMLVASGAFFWTLGIFAAKKELDSGVSLVTGAWSMLLTGILFAVLLTVRYFMKRGAVVFPESSDGWLAAGLIALLPGAFGIAAWFAALRRLPVSAAAAVLFFVPAAALFLPGKRVTWDVLNCVGLGLIAAGYVFMPARDAAAGGGKKSAASAKSSSGKKKEKKK